MATLGLDALLDVAEKSFKKKNKESEIPFQLAKDEKPPNGLILNNPLFEYILDRRVLTYGRFYLAYGKKGSGKTSFFFELAKTIQAANGYVIWLETENAADINYAQKQGVDLSKMILQHPPTLEDAINLAETYIRSMPTVYPDGQTPILICLDSIAGSTTAYESDTKHDMTDTMLGAHARILSRFYREMEHPLANERCIFLALNQQKEKIGGMSFGDEAPESMLGGNAPGFSSTYQFKFARTSDMLAPDDYGVKRKVGSTHKMTCKRNKLGREGNSQYIEFDLYAEGGIDWWGSTVDKLAADYPQILSKSGPTCKWHVENVEAVIDGQKGILNIDAKYSRDTLAKILRDSPAAQEVLREAWKIPVLPSDQIQKEVEEERLTKRKKRKSLTDETEDAEKLTKE